MNTGTTFLISKPPPERFQHRVVGLFATESLDTLTTSNSNTGTGCRALLEQVKQSSFPNSRFPGHEDHLPLTIHGFIEEVIELNQGVVTANDVLFGAFGVPRKGRRTVVGYRGDELIAPPGEGSDECGIVGMVSQNFASSST